MKIRTGFVSNSSSSSFVAICKRVSPEEAEKSKSDIYLRANDLCDGGYYLFDIGENFIKFIKENPDLVEGEVELFEMFKIAHDDCEISLEDIKDIPKGAIIMGGECTIHSYPDTEEGIDEFKRYVLNIEDNDEDEEDDENDDENDYEEDKDED